jgi:hypothetical protein
LSSTGLTFFLVGPLFKFVFEQGPLFELLGVVTRAHMIYTRAFA